MQTTHLLLVILFFIYAYPQSNGDHLINDKEVIVEFQEDEYKTFNYISTNSSLKTRIIITACSGAIEWNIFQSTVENKSTSILLHSSITNDREMFEFLSESASFIIKLKMNSPGYGSIVASNFLEEKSGKQPNGKKKSQILQMKWRSDSDIVLRWHKHKKNAQFLERNYCVVITTSRPQMNLCSALTQDEYIHLRNSTANELPASFIANYMTTADKLVYCTNTNLLKLNINNLLFKSQNDSKTSQIISAILYSFDKISRLPQRIASNETFSMRPSLVLEENKVTSIKTTNGPLKLSLKIHQKSFASSILDVFIVPCDIRMPFNVDIGINGNQLAVRNDIFGFAKLSVPNVQIKKSYLITVSPGQPNITASMLKGVQILATTMPGEYNPFPEMPRALAVKEYKTLRSCRSVTVGWIPPNYLRTATYCMVVKEGKVDAREFQGNQCTLNGQLRRGRVGQKDVAKMCKQMKHTARISVLTQKIDKLKPGKFYNVQIMVRKPKGRMLSYGALQVRTKSKC